MHALPLRRARAQTHFPASFVPWIWQGPLKQDEQAPTCDSSRARPEPPTRPDLPALAPALGTRYHHHDTLRSQVAQDQHSACAPPRTPLPLDVADIFDDTDAWSIFVPSKPCNSTSSINIGTKLSPLCIPETPMNTHLAHGPVEPIRDYATQPSPLLSSFLPEYASHDNNDDDDESWPMEEKLSSKWSC